MSRVVAIGGGHGLSAALRALRLCDVDATAIVTVADDGGSSGRLRRDLGIIAPGDLRRALVALAGNDRLATLMEHRFERGELQGHALGNLLLVALAERTGGDFVAALEGASGLLEGVGRVLPSTTQPVQLKARVSGSEVDGQARVTTSSGRIEQVWLEPSDAAACPEAVEALAAADVVVLGPGSLFTSIIVNLLVEDVVRVLGSRRVRTVYIGNISTQPGETDGLDLPAHLAALHEHAPNLVLDAAVIHDGPVPSGRGAALGTDTGDRVPGLVVRADLAARRRDGSVLGVHDPARLADALRPLLRA